MKREPKELKDRIEKQLADFLDKPEEPPPWKLQAVKLAIGFLAVQNKLEESEYGGFFGDGTGNGDASSVPERPKPAARRRKAEPDLLDDEPAGDGTRQ